MKNHYHLNGRKPVSGLVTAFFFLLLSITGSPLLAQPLSGTYNVPTDYATLAAAVNALNTQGVSGAVTINVLAGNPETAPAGGYAITASGTSANTITLQGNGNVITTSATLVAGSLNDAVFKLVGADYITLTGFTMQENAANTTTAAATNNMTEWGVALLYASATDGAQNNTIQGNTISLSRSYTNSFGIYSNVRHSATVINTTADITSPAGSNSNNKVYGNIISNVNMGITFIGSGTAANMDSGNDIGGSSSATGNMISNWGGAGAASGFISNSGTSYGIFVNHQTGENVSYNTLTSAAVSGTSVTFRGIFKDYTVTGPAGTFASSITSNTVTLSSGFTSGTFEAVRSQGMGTVATATLTINNNSVLNCVISGAASSSSMVCIANSSAPGTLSISNNIIQGNTSTATSGGFTGITNTGSVVNSNTISNNQVGNNSGNAITFSAATSSSITGISNSGSSSTGTVTISGNNFQGIVQSANGSGSHTYISTTAADASVTISNNTFTNITAATSGSVTFISHSYSIPATGVATITNNSIVTGFNKSVSGGTVTLTTTNGSSSNGATFMQTNNNFSNITVAGSTNITGFNNTDGAGTSPNKTVTGNVFNNWTAVTGTINCYNYSYIGGTNSISTNTITTVTGQGAVTGITINNSFGGTGTFNLSSNTISGLSSTGTGGNVTGITCANTNNLINISDNLVNNLSSSGASSTITGLAVTGATNTNVFRNTINTLAGSGATSPVANGISVSGGTAVTLYKNKIYDISQSGAISTTSPAVNGILISGGTTVNTYNNIVGDLRALSANLADAIRGISITSTATSSTYNVYYNTVNVKASSAGANFGTTAFFHAGSATATTAMLDLRNNIFVNNSTPNGTGLAVAYRINNTNLNNYASTSNNNLFFSGSPSANKLIFYDGTNSDQTLANFQTRVGPRESLSVTENVNFLSITGSSSTFLHIDNSIATVAESGGSNVSGITDDFDGDIRQGNAGYTGSGTAPDIGADEFNGINPNTCIGTPTAGSISGATAVCAGSVTTLTLTGTSTGPGFTYQWASSTTPGGPYTNLGTALTQSTGTLNATTYYTATVTCSGSGLTATTAEYTLTVNPLPTMGVTPTTGTICLPGGSAVALTASGASTYSWSPASGLTPSTGAAVSANPTVTTVYTVTGTDANNCSAAATATITVAPAVSLGSVTASPANICTGGSSTLTAAASPSSISYCASTHSSGCSLGDEIQQVTLNTINNSSSCTAGSYIYYNGGGTQTTTLTAGSTYTLSVKFGSDGNQYSGAWIDFNQDGTFSAGEFLGASGNGGSGGTIALTFTVPVGAFSGTTRLRVIGGNDSPVTSAQGCGSSSSNFGETEDYNVTITGGTSNSSFTYNWLPATFLSSTTGSPVTASSVTTTTTYTVNAVSAAGCSASGTVTLTVGIPLSSSASVSPNDTVCASTTFTLSSTPIGGGGPYTFAWNGPNSYTSTAQSPAVAATMAGAGVYTVTVTDNCSTQSTSTISITVNPQPSLTVTPATATLCLPGGSPVTLNVSGANTYTWSPAGSLTPSTGAVVMASPTVTTTYSVIGADALGCTDTATAIVNVAPSLTLSSITATPPAVCSGGTSTLTAVASPNNTYCTGPYTTGTGSSDYITNVTLDSINNTTGAAPSPYNTYYAGIGTTLAAGSTYTVSGTINNGGTEVTAVWIDYNQDGTFSASEKVGEQTGLTFAITFTVPATAVNGKTRMRVRDVFNTPGMLPCNVYTYGEIEDYDITITGGAPGLSFTWSPSTFLNTTTGTSVIASSVTVTTTYSAVATSSAGCSVSGTTSVTVSPLGALTLSVSPSNTVCAGTPITITSSISGGGAPYSYTWSPGGQNTANITVTPTVTTTYTLDLVDNCGTTASQTVTVNVNPLPVVSLTASSTLYCNPGTADTLTASGANTYTWSPAAGLSSATGASVSATPTITTTYVVTGSDNNGCMDTAMVTIISAPAVTGYTAAVSASPVCAGTPISLTSSANPYTVTLLKENFNVGAPAWTRINNSTGGTPANAAWIDRPDGFVYSSGTPYHSNDSTQFVQSNSDAQGSGSITSTILQSPAFSTLGLSNLSLNFYQFFRALSDSAIVEASSNGTTWAKIGAFTSTSGSEGVFALANITLPAAYNNQATVYVRFRYEATWDWYWSIDNVSVTGGSSNFTYNWTSAPGGFTSTLQNPVGVMPATSTSYSVDITNIYGCSATATASVTVNPLPVVSLGNDSALCGGTLVLDAGNAGSAYMWSDSSTAQTLTVDSTGTYYVTVTNSLSCTSSDTINVTINPVPVVNLGVDTAQCGGTVMLDAGNAGATYLWNTSATTQTIVASSSGMYDVSVTNTQGCTNSDTVNVTINPVPVVNLGNDTVICGGSVVLNAGNAGATYLWSDASTAQTLTVTTTGVYFVDVTNVQGCTSRDTADVTVNPAISVNLGNDSAICTNATLILDAQNPGANYQWNDGSTSSILVVVGPGTYYVTVTYTYGCTASDTVTFTDNSPVVTLSLPVDSVCVNANPIALSGGSPASGTYSGSGVSGTTFDPSAAGVGTSAITYMYTDSNTGCSAMATDNIVVNSCVGINAITTVAQIKVYPNPASNSFVIELPDASDKVNATLHSAEGKLIFSEELTGKTVFKYDIDKLGDGIYYLELRSAEGNKVIKLVKQF